MDTSLDPAGTATTSVVNPRRPLADFLPDGPSPHPVVELASSGHLTVLIGRAGDHNVLIAPASVCGPTLVPADLWAVPVLDPLVQIETLRTAVSVMATKVGSLTKEFDHASIEHQDKVHQIRDYAIDKHRDGTICRDGLNAFLKHFDLAIYDPEIRINFTVTGSYLIKGDDIRQAESDAEQALDIDFDDIDGYIYGTGDCTVTVDDSNIVDD